MENKGKRWTDDEEHELLTLVKTCSIAQIANNFKRTEGSITSRLDKIALEMHKMGTSLHDIAEATTLSNLHLTNLFELKELPNSNADWDSPQDEWLKKYIKKLGIDGCASKMGRLHTEIEKRQLYLAIEDITNNIPIEKVCSQLCLNIDDFKKKLSSMKSFVPLDKLDMLPKEPPYYVVLNGRCNGVYSNIDGFQMATIGFEDAKYKRCNSLMDVHKYIEKGHVNTVKEDAFKPKIILSDEQNKVIEAVFEGKNVLLLGSAGVGKSLIIKHITSICKERNISIGITSSTGCSAVLIDGKTIHSFLGIGLAVDSPTVLARNLFYKNKKKARALQDLEILLIDEISMLDAELLTKISKYLSIVRDNVKPFGGLQIILSGDFYQLPPVKGQFAFKSEIWESFNMSCHILKKIYRQQDDVVFQGILERAKDSSITDEDIEILKECKGQAFKDDVKPTCLYPINATVDKINNEEYKLLNGNEMVYDTIYDTIYNSKESRTYCDSIKIPASVKLKVGAQVMVTRNINSDLKLANGTRGVITQMTEEAVVIKTIYGDRVITWFDCVNENDIKLKYSIMPLALAWALTIHKAQGVTLDCATIDIGKSLFEYGQAYTALSRVKSLKGLSVSSVEKSAFKTHDDVIEFYKTI